MGTFYIKIVKIGSDISLTRKANFDSNIQTWYYCYSIKVTPTEGKPKLPTKT